MCACWLYRYCYTRGMDELEISGRRYISTKRAGKDHKYHADYIGQLIRAKKVDGQKVGRSWYVDAESLAEYLGTEAPLSKSKAPVARIVEKAPEPMPAPKKVIEEIETVEFAEEVAPDIAEVAETIDAPQELATEEAHIPIKISEPAAPMFYRSVKDEREARKGLRYIADEGPLLPRVQKSAPPPVMRHSVPAPVQTRISIHTQREEPAAYAKEHIREEARDTTREEKVFAHIAPLTRKAPAKKISKSMFIVRQAGAVLVLGAIIFGVTMLLSSKLLFTQTIDGEGGASVGYSIK